MENKIGISAMLEMNKRAESLIEEMNISSSNAMANLIQLNILVSYVYGRYVSSNPPESQSPNASRLGVICSEISSLIPYLSGHSYLSMHNALKYMSIVSNVTSYVAGIFNDMEEHLDSHDWGKDVMVNVSPILEGVISPELAKSNVDVKSMLGD